MIKAWILAGAFLAVSAPGAFALESLAESPPEPRPLFARVDTIMPDAAEARRASRHNARQPTQRNTPADRRRVEAQEEEERRSREEAQRRRRNPMYDRVPDAVLLERRGTL